MPRRAWLALGGIPWHIIQRGNNRSACFYRNSDYRYYLDTLFRLATEKNCLVHAYVLMTNHVHLLITPSEKESTGQLMKHLGQRYVQYINRTYRRSGTLWEGRFKSSLVQSSHYVLACYRYIELNPVRAGLVSHPREYRWSSYGVNGQGIRSTTITPHDEYLELGLNITNRLRTYRELFHSEIDAEVIDQIRMATNSNYALGNDRFKDEIEQMLKQRARPGKRGRPFLAD